MNDRELDADIAEKVFGWKHIIRGKVAWVGDNDPLWHGITPEGTGTWVPHYSTDITEAWTILEHKPSNWSITIVLHVVGDGPRYDVSVDLRDDDGYIVRCLGQARSRSAPKAICQAVLEAKVKEQEHV